VSETARGRYRRELLLDATAELVAERGFHRVGIAEIGAAAGVSGAAIYRHFASKDALLIALIDRVVDELLDRARGICARAPTPEEALAQLVAAHVEFALRERSIIKVYDQEAHHLPDEEHRRMRRMQRTYAETWVDVLVACGGAPGRPQARAVVHAVFGLLNSVADFESRLARDELAALLRTMAESVLEGALRPEASVTVPSA
jgi:AcrR family transcriptional regulator